MSRVRVFLIHTFQTTYRNAFNRPYADFIEHFFATASRAVHELPNRFVNGHWQVWVYGPDLVKEFLKVISFPRFTRILCSNLSFLERPFQYWRCPSIESDCDYPYRAQIFEEMQRP